MGRTPSPKSRQDRWDAKAYYHPDADQPGTMYAPWGGFLRDIDRFDPQFFGIAPREARQMDPQQRLLLEVAWEALETAGQSPDSLLGTQTGVFVGISTNDYGLLQAKAGGPMGIDGYSGTGTAFSVAAGRISYVLGLQGPCIALDTACSSSLVAVHLACPESARGQVQPGTGGRREPDPLARDVHLLLEAPRLAADGRCKTFDAAADGYVRSEGCGIVVLKRLSMPSAPATTSWPSFAVQLSTRTAAAAALGSQRTRPAGRDSRRAGRR
jgi:acyl transferase domain-containing protein